MGPQEVVFLGLLVQHQFLTPDQFPPLLLAGPPEDVAALVGRILGRGLFPPEARGPLLDLAATVGRDGDTPMSADVALRRGAALDALRAVRAAGLVHDVLGPTTPRLPVAAPSPAPTPVPGAGPRPGQEWGDFRIEAEIDRGGFGTVFRAADLRSGRTVALKVLTAGLAAQPDERGRFRREGKLACGLRHPHIVPVHEAGECDGRLYLAMELIAGEPLDHVLKRMGRLPVRAAVRIVAQVCSAVAYAHACDVLHRDIKPGNILLSPRWGETFGQTEGTQRLESVFGACESLLLGGGPAPAPWPLLADFGLARSMRPDEVTQFHTATGDVMGTLGYMSPEAADSDRLRVGVRSDVYSLGATLYHLVTGHNTFTATSQQRLLARIRREEPASPRLRVPDLPADLDTIILTALRHRPEDRYATADEMLADLLALAAGRPVARPRPANKRRITVHHPQDDSEMAVIPAGDYVIGSLHGDPNEQPPHGVRLAGFLIDVHPVTVGQYERFLADVPRAGHRTCHPDEPRDHEHTPATWSEARRAGMEMPVQGVDWWDAYAYAAWAGKRLCTEAEWEVACRAEAETEFAHGNDPRPLQLYAWYDRNSGGKPHPVEELAPNAWGLYDMHGNVAEWCADWYDERAYTSPGADRGAGPDHGTHRVYRGGGFSASSLMQRCAHRTGLAPGKRIRILGFRCARSAGGQA